MNKILVALITLGLLLAPISAVQAQSNEQYISLVFSDDTVYVDAGDYIILGHGWGACTLGFIQMYLNAVQTELTFDGILIATTDGKDQYWGPITDFPDGYWVTDCVAGNQNSSSIVNWRYPLGTLAPGDYEVHFYYWLDRTIFDGADYDGDGQMDAMSGLLLDRTFTIVVQ